MAEVTRTELNQQTARVLARVAAGERLTITDRGRAVAELIPPHTSPWDELVAAGKVLPARSSGPVTLLPPLELDTTVDEILRDLRGDRE